MLDDALAEIEPTLVGFRVGRRGGRRGFGIEDVGGAEVGAKFLRDDGPAHEFGDGEEFEELGLCGDESVASIKMNAMEEVGLLVVVRGKDYIVYYALEDLRGLGVRFSVMKGATGLEREEADLQRGVVPDWIRRILCQELGDNVCRHQDIYRHVWLG